ncbi:MAG: hypothetical protein K0V04_45520 [Deltaproteobacteria bacterium]|nr:hypothetical protein [Deltaproteobacteria bacterium]
MHYSSVLGRLALGGLVGVVGCVDPPPAVETEGSSDSSGPPPGETTVVDMSTSSSGDPDTTAVDTTGPDNEVPLAEPDEYCTQQGAGLFTAPFSILDNDTDLDGTITLMSTGRLPTAFGGVVDMEDDGTFTYQAPPRSSGDDFFNYLISDDAGTPAGATVTLHVAPLRVGLDDVAAGTGGFAMTGDAANESRAGFAVAGGGDVNGDGLDDVIVGAHRGFANAGQTFVVFGKPDGMPVELAAIDDENSPDGFAIRGSASEHFSGFSVAGAGDVDADGLADVVLGAPGVDTDMRLGRVYLVRGRTETSLVNLSDIDMLGDTTVGVAFDGVDLFGAMGASVDGGRDIDGDGRPDLLISSPAYESDAAASLVYLLLDFPLDQPLIQPDLLMASQVSIFTGLTDQGSGRPARLLGDIDDDGLPDFAFGSHDLGLFGVGRAYVRLSSQGLGNFDAGQMELGIGGFVLDGVDPSDDLGAGIGDAGDFNGDGIADLLIGAPGRSFGAASGGLIYVIFGGDLSVPPTLTDLQAGVGGLIIVGDDGELTQAGFTVQGIGDFNGDGRDDIAIGAPSVMALDNQVCQISRIYVVFGSDEPGPIMLSDVASGQGGLPIDAEMESDCAGWSMDAAGDVDGDGLRDVVIGAPRWFDAGIAGRAYVVHGFTAEHPRACPS